MSLANPNRIRITGPHRTGSNRPKPPRQRIEWTEEEIQAAATAVQALLYSHSATPRTKGEAVLEAVAPFVLERIREASEKAWNEGFDAGRNQKGVVSE